MRFLKLDEKLQNHQLFYVLCCAVVYLVIQLLVCFGVLNNYIEQVIMLACVNVMVTVSLNLVNGYTGLYSLGQAGFMAVGAYASATLTTLVFNTASWPTYLSIPFFFLSLLIGGAAAALVGYLIGLPTLRIKGDYLAIVTLAAGEIIRATLNLIPYTGAARGMINIPRYASLPIVFGWMFLCIFIIRNYTRSAYGRAAVAIRDNEIAASTMGISLLKYKTLSFVIAAFFSGVAGGLFAHITMFINPEQFKSTKSTDFLVFLYAGGTGSISGSILGAGVLTIFQEILRVLQDWRLVIYAALLVIIMVKRENGIYGGKEFRFLRVNNYLVHNKVPVDIHNAPKENPLFRWVTSKIRDTKNSKD